MRSLFALALATAALIGACSPDKPKPVDEPTKAAASPAPIPTDSASAATAAGRVSRYTDLDSCKEIEREPEGDGVTFLCDGLAGYDFLLVAGDSRESIDMLLPGDDNPHPLNIMQASGPGGFNRLGDKIEWRGIEVDGKFRPDALIVRLFVVEDPEDTEKETPYLITASLTGTPCSTGRVSPGPSQNEQARAITDGKMRCLPPRCLPPP